MKQVAGWAVLTIVPLLFVAALFMGSDTPKEEEKPDEDEVAEEVKKAEELVEEVPEELIGEEVEAEEPDDVDLSLPGDTDKKEAQAVAIDFITAFHRVDPEDPYRYADDAQEFMSRDLYDYYKGIPKRGTLEAAKIDVEHVEAMPAELNENEQVWTLVLTSSQADAEGQVESVYDEYAVLVRQEAGAWRVNGVKLNER